MLQGLLAELMPTLVRGDGLRVEAAYVVKNADGIGGVTALAQADINFGVASLFLARPLFPQRALAKNIHFQRRLRDCNGTKRACVSHKTSLHEVRQTIPKCLIAQRQF